MIYFTADQHFGHNNIIKFVGRPDVDVASMDARLIREWNETIGPDDSVYQLGDFTLNEFKSFNGYVSKLNRKIFIVPGGHDKRWLADMAGGHLSTSLSDHVVQPLPMLHHLHVDGSRAPIVLCHYPLLHWEASYHGSIHLHGHDHAKYFDSGLALDVGVDNETIYGIPISLEDVLIMMNHRIDTGTKPS